MTVDFFAIEPTDQLDNLVEERLVGLPSVVVFEEETREPLGESVRPTGDVGIDLKDTDLTGISPVELVNRVQSWQEQLDE